VVVKQQLSRCRTGGGSPAKKEIKTMASRTSENGDIIHSVALALQVLETLAQARDSMGVTELANELGTAKSRIYRHLRTLISLGYISQSHLTERYRIGARLISLGRAAAESADLTSVAQHHMRVLRDRTGQAVSFGQIEETGIRVLNTISGNMQIDVGVRPGSLLGFCNSAQGKVALAFMSEEERSRLIPRKIPATTAFTITDRDKLLSHISEVAERGWATAPNENMLGLNALACPIFNAEREVAATIAIVSLTQYIETPPDPDQAAAVKAAAENISTDLGYAP